MMVRSALQQIEMQRSQQAPVFVGIFAAVAPFPLGLLQGAGLRPQR